MNLFKNYKPNRRFTIDHRKIFAPNRCNLTAVVKATESNREQQLNRVEKAEFVSTKVTWFQRYYWFSIN